MAGGTLSAVEVGGVPLPLPERCGREVVIGLRGLGAVAASRRRCCRSQYLSAAIAEGGDELDRSTPPRLHEFVTTDLAGAYAAFGVGDLVGVDGTEDRVVNLSPRSDVVCPMHRFRLVPDACRSCRFLAGEVAPVSHAEPA